jgi:hypothetical protein
MIYVIRIDIITKRVSYLCTLHKQATQCCLVFLTKAVCDRISIDLSSIIYVTIEFSQLPFLKYLSNESYLLWGGAVPVCLPRVWRAEYPRFVSCPSVLCMEI